MVGCWPLAHLPSNPQGRPKAPKTLIFFDEIAAGRSVFSLIVFSYPFQLVVEPSDVQNCTPAVGLSMFCDDKRRLLDVVAVTATALDHVALCRLALSFNSPLRLFVKGSAVLGLPTE